MKKVITILLCISFAFICVGCKIQDGSVAISQNNNKMMQNTGESSSQNVSLSQEEIWDSLVDKIRPDVDKIKENSVSDSIIDEDKWEQLNRISEQESVDLENYTDVESVYKNIERFKSNDNEYIGIFLCAGGVVHDEYTTDTEFIKRLTDFFESLQLRQITAEERYEMTETVPDFVEIGEGGFYTGTSNIILSFVFYGNENSYKDVTLEQTNESENDLERGFIASYLGRDFIITNFEEIKDEYYDIYAICTLLFEE